MQFLPTVVVLPRSATIASRARRLVSVAFASPRAARHLCMILASLSARRKSTMTPADRQIHSAMRPDVNAPVKRPGSLGRALGLIGVLAVAVAVGFAVDRHASSADALSAPSQNGASFDPAVVARGAWLAAIGNCGSCHTASDGATFAGGRPLSTPFGTIYATNITPDPETGIGRWSSSDFLRAMHEGLGKDGRELYPAFPYDHFTHVTDEDVNAIYAFLMTRDPAARGHARESHPRPEGGSRRVEGALLQSRTARSRHRARCALEPRPLSGRRTRPLRRLPHTAQRVRRREERPRISPAAASKAGARRR